MCIKKRDKLILMSITIIRSLGPIVGFVAQFLFMPGFSFLVGYIFTQDKLFR